jgi:hypothetical protein
MSWFNRDRTKELVAEIRDSFQMVEKDGFMWIAVHGVAFRKIPKESTSEEMLNELETARKAAVEFSGLSYE